MQSERKYKSTGVSRDEGDWNGGRGAGTVSEHEALSRVMGIL